MLFYIYRNIIVKLQNLLCKYVLLMIKREIVESATERACRENSETLGISEPEFRHRNPIKFNTRHHLI